MEGLEFSVLAVGFVLVLNAGLGFQISAALHESKQKFCFGFWVIEIGAGFLGEDLARRATIRMGILLPPCSIRVCMCIYIYMYTVHTHAYPNFYRLEFG